MLTQQSPRAALDRLRSTSNVAFRYLLVSGATMFGHQSILFVANSILGWGGGWANIAAASVMAIPAYLANRNWVWAVEGPHSIHRHVAPFWILAIVGLLASTGCSAIAHKLFGAGLMVNVASLVGYGGVWVAKFFILGRVFRHRVLPAT